MLGIAAVWFTKAVVGIASSAVLAPLVVVPALIYVIFKGYLTQLSGPGGWSATFKVTNASVSFGTQKLDMAAQAQMLPKGSAGELREAIEQLDPNEPVLLTIKLGERYSHQVLRRYLEALNSLPRFRLVVFLDSSNRFLGCIGANGLESLLVSGNLGSIFLEAIEDNRISVFARYPGVVREVIKTDATNTEALTLMERYGLDALAVVDENRHIKGVVERQQIVTKLLLSVVHDATKL